MNNQGEETKGNENQPKLKNFTLNFILSYITCTQKVSFPDWLHSTSESLRILLGSYMYYTYMYIYAVWATYHEAKN